MKIHVSLAFRNCRRHCEPKGRGNLAFHQKQRRDCFALARNDLKLQGDTKILYANKRR